jgi:uncharacterized protein YacL
MASSQLSGNGCSMALLILRILFVGVSIGLGVLLVNTGQVPSQPAWTPVAVFAGVIGAALLVIGLDVSLRRKKLDVISAIYFGLIVGLFLAHIVGLALSPLLLNHEPAITPWLMPILSVVFSYVCISLLMQTRNDFRFIIPYVEFAKEVKGARPFLLDTSAVIDGRIADLIAGGVFDGQIIIPRFVVHELQNVADSSDKAKRGRGRRGLDILNRLRTLGDVDLVIDEQELPEFNGQPVDMRLVLLARHVRGKLVTTDYNLNKVAKLNSVPVLNVNDLANALKPAFTAGDVLDVRIAKPGEEARQGVGYLDDGTMIVVEGARDQVGETIRVTVTSVLQTSAGRMVFGKSGGAAASAPAAGGAAASAAASAER